MSSGQAAKYFIYATRWGALFLTFTMAYNAFLVTYRFVAQKSNQKIVGVFFESGPGKMLFN